MRHQVNSYFAVLLITVVGIGAAQFIIHFAYDNAFVIALGNQTSSLDSQSK